MKKFLSIPYSILKHKQINSLQKMLYCYIYGFKEFYMKDINLAKHFDIPITTLQNNLRTLELIKYIKRFTSPIKEGGSRRKIECLIDIPDYPKTNSEYPKHKESSTQNSTINYSKVVSPNKDIRISNNNRDNTISPKLVSDMKTKYPEDFEVINRKFFDYYLPKGYSITDEKYEKWFKNENTNSSNKTTGTDHSDIILKAIKKYGFARSDELQQYCREHGDEDTMSIIKNAKLFNLCKMNEDQFNNNYLLKFLSVSPLTNNGKSDNVRNGSVESIEDIVKGKRYGQ